MNAANLCPSPTVVSDRVSELTRDIDRDCSFNNRGKFGPLRERSRSLVAEHLKVSPDEIALVSNTSEANNTINNGLPLSEGDEVVIWDQNHPTNNVAWDVRAARFGIKVKRVSVPRTPESAQSIIDAFAEALTDRTRVLAITHVSNLSGIRLPVVELVDLAHERGIHVHLDGAQSWGVLDLDLRALNVDSYSSSTHKWFMGPKEAGILYVKASRIETIWPNVISVGWGNDADPDMTGAKKFESLGQRDDACLAAVGTTVEFHNAIGLAQVEARVHELVAMLMEGLQGMGMKVVTPSDPSLSAGVCIIEVAGSGRTVMNALYEEHGIAVAPTGGLRLSPHVYNTEEHIERALAGVHALRREILG